MAGTERIRFVEQRVDDLGRKRTGTAYKGSDGYWHGTYDAEPDLTYLISEREMNDPSKYEILPCI